MIVIRQKYYSEDLVPIDQLLDETDLLMDKVGDIHPVVEKATRRKRGLIKGIIQAYKDLKKSKSKSDSIKK